MGTIVLVVNLARSVERRLADRWSLVKPLWKLVCFCTKVVAPSQLKHRDISSRRFPLEVVRDSFGWVVGSHQIDIVVGWADASSASGCLIRSTESILEEMISVELLLWTATVVGGGCCRLSNVERGLVLG